MQTRMQICQVNLAENNLCGETGYVKATEVQGSSFNVRDEVIYKGQKMVISRGKDSDGDIKMKPVNWLEGITALADAIAVSASLVQVLAFLCLKPRCTDCTLPHALTKRQVNLSRNSIGPEGKAALQEAVKEEQGFTLEL